MRERVGEASMAEERGCRERAGGREERQPRGAGAGERSEEGGESGGVARAGELRERREVRVEGLRRGGGRSGVGGDGARGGEAVEEQARGGPRWGHAGSDGWMARTAGASQSQTHSN